MSPSKCVPHFVCAQPIRLNCNWLQVTSYVLTLGGYILGHSHGGRMFPETIHGTFASILFAPLIAQFVIGVYLKLHIHEKSIRPYVVVVHGVIGKAWPILGWTQMLFGALTLRGYWCVGSFALNFRSCSLA